MQADDTYGDLGAKIKERLESANMTIHLNLIYFPQDQFQEKVNLLFFFFFVKVSMLFL